MASQAGPIVNDCFDACLRDAGVCMACFSTDGKTYIPTNQTLTVNPDPNTIGTAIDPQEVYARTRHCISGCNAHLVPHAQVPFATATIIPFTLTGMIAPGARGGFSRSGDCGDDLTQVAPIAAGGSFSAAFPTVSMAPCYMQCRAKTLYSIPTTYSSRACTSFATARQQVTRSPRSRASRSWSS